MSQLSSIARAVSLPLSGALLIALASGCIDGLVVDVQELSERDAGVPLVDAGQLDAAPEPVEPPRADAGSTPPIMDAGKPSDAGNDAGSDAGHDAGAPVSQDAGEKPDAGCVGSRCDAGSTPQTGPCATCGPITLVQPANTDPVCDNGAPTVCWTNPVGECTMQCPTTGSCTRDNPGVCGPEHYCYFPKLDCGTITAGFCAPLPKQCGTTEVPVCGCDGKVHTNPCAAAKVGTAVWTGLPEEHCK